jgi:hypothetical protein
MRKQTKEKNTAELLKRVDSFLDGTLCFCAPGVAQTERSRSLL